MVVLPDNTVEQRFLILGPQNEGEVVASSGLSEGELVIVEGMHRVRHGQAVRPVTVDEYDERKAARREAQAPDPSPDET